MLASARAEGSPPVVGPEYAPSAVSTHDAAVSEFKQARRLIEAGDCAQGVPHLEESLAYEPSIGARLSLAECVEKTDPLRAWRSLADASLLAYANHDDRNTLIDRRLADVEHALPLVHVGLSATDIERPGLEVILDGRLVDRHHAKRRIAVEPGAHTLEIRAFGKAPWVRSFSAPAPGTVVEMAVQLVDRAGEAPAPAPAPRVVVVVAGDAGSTRRTVGLTIGALGVAAIGTGAVFGLLAIMKGSELDDACGGDRASCTARPEAVAPLSENASTLAAVSTVSFAVGGAAIITGAALYLWPSSKSPSSVPTSTATTRVRVTPLLLGPIQGAAFEGVF